MKTLGRYVIVRRLATGGMAEILLAKTVGPEGFSREVVLKRILPHLSARAEIAESFLNESRLSVRLIHPNIGQVFELGEDGGRFLAMEYLRGFDLSTILHAARAANERVPLEIALRIAMDVLEGLHFAHEARDDDGRPLAIVHRDVAPSNVIVTFDGITKVVDFGIAKAMALAEQRTATGALKGTCSYMAPEQIATQHEIDRRADVFASGALFFELFSGRNPFRGDNDYQTMHNIIHLAAPSLRELRPELPAAIDQVVQHALSKHPSERFQTQEEMLDALAEASVGHEATRSDVAAYLDAHRAAFEDMAENLTDRVETEAGAMTPPPSRRFRLALAGALLVLVLVGAGVALRRAPSGGAGEGASGAQALLEVRSTPPGMVVLVDGTLVTGETPLSLSHDAPARVTVEWIVDHRRIGKEQIDVQPAQSYHLSYSAAGEASRPPAPQIDKTSAAVSMPKGGSGRLRVVALPWGVVWVDGRRIGETPLDPAGVELPAGEHDVRIENAELGKRVDRKVIVQANKLALLRETFVE